MSGVWLADPATKEPLAALPSKELELSYAATHWRPGWRSGIERDERGTPLRMWFAQCPDPCCADYRAAQPSLDELAGRVRRG